ncbi:hypothetical protein A3D11_03610 [Candidatus Peribacteria bacterium RIFCSPHIGHO2_02_FULL_49_16]|nr:MAG: hypothetical protein A2880_04570 [Candidatus Peribacteria bacterium RIFCSPHIGHO2_01_FULL_49_38]OGJ58820.1 MAG: hypothetical protein A3D11_03610 [Candidatus Peribacteria bacterium RIFCSPHIGHO2_02_FULL_49_16]
MIDHSQDPKQAREVYDTYWESTEDSYPHYPTIRHRKRFILKEIQKFLQCHSEPAEGYTSIFDFGCGEASLLTTIQQTFRIPQKHLAGNDISAFAVKRAQQKIPEGTFFPSAFPATDQKYHIIICSEVIEHTTEYQKILRWIFDHLRKNGLLILTTQSGRIHASDRYTHHTQHFKKSCLDALLKNIGFHIQSSRLWGWPFFTVQKYLTDVNFDHVRDRYLEGNISPSKKRIFNAAYASYHLHDLIPFGPQIYSTAKKT